MRTITWSLAGVILSVGLLLCFSPGSTRAGDNPSPGVVRITDHSASQAPTAMTGNTATGPVLELSGNPLVDRWRMARFDRQIERQAQSECDECQGGDGRPERSSCRERFGYFVPTGGCGEGVPCMRHYAMDYAVNPEYFDQRDGQLFSAPGYGAPMAVPLAPNVGYTYNHGWGIPSSRLTPVSRFAPHPMYLRQQ